MSRCLKYHFPAGDSRNIIPPYIKKDGFQVPCVPANFERLGILVRVDATPEPGKTITKSHGEIIDGEWWEIIDEQLTPEEIEAARQAAKPLALKQAENDYFSVVNQIPDATYADNSSVLKSKIELSGLTDSEKNTLGILLMNAIREVDLKGGSWYDLPTQPHNI